MCGRFVQQMPPTAYARLYGVKGEEAPLPNTAPRYNAAPTQDLLVLRRNPQTGQRVLSLLKWGLVPAWAKESSGGARLINARSETVRDKPSFRAAWFKKRRCIIPADGFYEWQRQEGRKQPFYITLKNRAPMSFAGLWEGWKNPSSGQWMRTFTILTCPANEAISALHERMPVILARNDISTFLTAEDPFHLLHPCPAQDIETWPVSSAVNNVHNDGPDLMQPAPV
ncbi:MAG: SOS response-associated peptidase [Xanthobacter sp.]